MKCPARLTLLGILLTGLVSNTLAADAENIGATMTQTAQKFIASLTPEQRAKTVLDFNDPSRLDWHNIPKPQRKGLQLRDMTPEQRQLCHALLRAELSETGYAKATKIMALENNLHEGEKNLKDGPLRDPERYFLTIFGQPELKGTWGWSFEGHHFSQNLVIRDGKIVADTPSFWGANPATVQIYVPGGPDKGTRTLAQEEQLALDLASSLTEDQWKKAKIADKAPAEYRTPGAPQAPHTPAEGLPASEMTTAQQQTLLSLLETYNNNLAPELARARMTQALTGGPGAIRFAWAGPNKPGVGHYYRIQGPTFVLELVNVQTDPAGNPANHVHSVWRSLQGDFGVAADDKK